MTGYFITATDTDAGKTWVSTQLLHYWQQCGHRTLGFKPIASGCQQTLKGLQNEDALKIMAVSNITLPYPQINPYAFKPAIAPHIAAKKAKIHINIQEIADNILAQQHKADYILVEGVGGWLVPLNKKETLADLAYLLNFPIILVVQLRLGCINQALLTAQAIEQKGLPIAGWIANNSHSSKEHVMSHKAENIASLKARLKPPFLGELPYFSETELNNGIILDDFLNLNLLNLNLLETKAI